MDRSGDMVWIIKPIYSLINAYFRLCFRTSTVIAFTNNRSELVYIDGHENSNDATQEFPDPHEHVKIQPIVVLPIIVLITSTSLVPLFAFDITSIGDARSTTALVNYRVKKWDDYVPTLLGYFANLRIGNLAQIEFALYPRTTAGVETGVLFGWVVFTKPSPGIEMQILEIPLRGTFRASKDSWTVRLHLGALFSYQSATSNSSRTLVGAEVGIQLGWDRIFVELGYIFWYGDIQNYPNLGIGVRL